MAGNEVRPVQLNQVCSMLVAATVFMAGKLERDAHPSQQFWKSVTFDKSSNGNAVRLAQPSQALFAFVTLLVFTSGKLVRLEQFLQAN